MIKKQILILEVNQHNFDILNTLFQKSGFTCKAVLDEESFFKIKADMFENNIILVNTSISYATPEQIIQESTQDGVNIPTIFIDGAEKYDKEKLSECFKAGASDYVKKPFESVELVSRVKYHAEGYNKIREYQSKIKKLANIAAVDQLSKLTSKMQMQVILKYQIDYFNRYETETSVVYLSLINISKIIGLFGLNHGEKAISAFAGEIKKLIRVSDILARWEGSDFIIILSNTNKESAELMIKKLIVKLSRIEKLQELKLELAFGITDIAKNDELKMVIERAKFALEEAKQQRYTKIFVA